MRFTAFTGILQRCGSLRSPASYGDIDTLSRQDLTPHRRRGVNSGV